MMRHCGIFRDTIVILVQSQQRQPWGNEFYISKLFASLQGGNRKLVVSESATRVGELHTHTLCALNLHAKLLKADMANANNQLYRK
eukprot:1159657-Pelagomonas_calceolata.AAC.2